jgi:predicted Fe-Mo cluster-binding NifX family protein
MKVAVSASGTTLDAAVDPRFGRCATFLLVDTDDGSYEAVDNGSAALGGGAGIQSAQLMARKGVKAVLTGNCGPNAHQTLAAAGIEVFVGCTGTIREAIERYRQGRLEPASAANVASHAGMGQRPR